MREKIKPSIDIENLNSNTFTFDEESYLLCLLFKFGYGNWSKIKYHILHDPKIQFNLMFRLM